MENKNDNNSELLTNDLKTDIEPITDNNQNTQADITKTPVDTNDSAEHSGVLTEFSADNSSIIHADENNNASANPDIEKLSSPVEQSSDSCSQNIEQQPEQTDHESNTAENATPTAQLLPKTFKITADNGSQQTLVSRIFNILAYLPLLTLSILYIAQAFFLIDNHELWYSDEVRHGDVLKNLLESKDWFVLHLNGEFYPDKPPLYFLFLVGIKYLLVFLDQIVAPFIASMTGFNLSFLNQDRIVPQLMSLGASISGFFFLWSSYYFAKIVGRFDRRLSFATGLVLLSSIYFMVTTHYARMDLFFASLIIISQIFLFKAIQKDKSIPLMLSAFIFMALASLTKGPLGFAFPLLTTIAYLIWQKRLRRLLCSDFWIALGVGVALTLSWFIILILRFDFNYVYASIVDKQVIQRGINAWHHKKAWYTYLWLLPLMYLPFSLLLPLANFKNIKQRLLSSKEAEYQGLSYLWLFALTGFILLSIISTKIDIYLLPLFAPLAAITAKQILNLSEQKSQYFRYILAFFATLLILVGALPLIQPYVLPNLYADENIRVLGTIFIAGIAVVFSAIFWAGIKGRRPEALLLTFAIFICLIMQPMFLVTAPSMNKILSPHDQALILKEYTKDGYTPASYRVYKGIYSVYLNDKFLELDNQNALEKFITNNNKVVLAVKAKDYTEFTPETIKKLQAENKQYVIDDKQRLLTTLKPLKKINQQRIAEELIFLLATDQTPEAQKAAPISDAQTTTELQTATPSSETKTEETQSQTSETNSTAVINSTNATNATEATNSIKLTSEPSELSTKLSNSTAIVNSHSNSTTSEQNTNSTETKSTQE